MSGPHSTFLPTEVYSDNPSYTSLFRPKIHKQAINSDHATVQCQIDLLGRDNVGCKFGSMNAHAGNFTALTAPNCLPERLALISYTIEYGFLHDDELDNLTSTETILSENRMLLQAINPEQGRGIPSSGQSKGSLRKSEVQAKIAAEFLRLDPLFGKWFLSYWKEFTQSTQDVRELKFRSLDEYLDYRVIDTGAIWTLSIIRWGTGIYLTPDEEKIAGPISYLGYAALALTNDFFSWEKEHNASLQGNGTVPLVNAVHIIMESEKISETSAKALIQAEIRSHEESFAKLKRDYKSSANPSQSIIQWLDLLEDTIAGNFVWSLKVPRYNKVPGNPYKDHLECSDDDSVRVLAPYKPGSIPTQQNGPSGTSEQLAIANSNEIGDVKIVPSITLDEEILLKPYFYLTSLPSKGIRSSLAAALNRWYMVPQQALRIIEEIAELLHSSSLLLDDIQDGSSLRRGKPAAHTIFGVSQTINTATYLMNKSLSLAQTLSEPAVSIYVEELRNLHVGQAHDIHWSHYAQIPTQSEYISMVDGKTGGLFRLLGRFMKTEATLNRDLDLNHFMTLLGRYFQIRDDYVNLASADYAKQKGFCEDLEEGKFSFPLLIGINSSSSTRALLLGIINSRHHQGGISKEMKEYVLEQLFSQESFSQTRSILASLHAEILGLLADVEERLGGTENWGLRLLVMKLAIDGKVHKEEASIESVWKHNRQRAWEKLQGRPRPVNLARLLTQVNIYGES